METLAESKVPLRDHCRQGFTVVEMVVVIGIIMVLSGFLLTAVAKARAHAQSVACKSQLHQIGVALAGYAADHKGDQIPCDGWGSPFRLRTWATMLFGAEARKATVCPMEIEGETLTYQLNDWLLLGQIRLGASTMAVPPSDILVAAENPYGTNYQLSMDLPRGDTSFDPIRHGEGLKANYLWDDFHVSSDPPAYRPETESYWRAW